MRKLLTIGLIWISCAQGIAQVQEQVSADTAVLTFQDAVKIALMNNVTLNQQKNLLEVSQVQRNSAIASVGPTVSLNASATQFNGNSFNQQQGRAINGIRDNVSGSLNANMVLFGGFSRINSIRQYSSLFDAQAYLVDRTAQDVINTVSTQYLQVLMDIELLRIAKENFQLQEQQLQQVQELVKLGSRAPVDEYNQDALTKNAELRYIQAGITLNNDKALLTQTLLIDPFEHFKVEQPRWNLNEISNESVQPDSMLSIALEHRGDYKRAEKNESAQRFGSMTAKSLMMPSLVAFFNYGSGYNFQHGVPDSATFYSTDYILAGSQIQKVVTDTTVSNPDIPRPFKEQFRTNNVYKSYGLQLTIPLFNGLQNRSTYVQQRVAYRNAQLLKKSTEFQVKNDVLRTSLNFEGVRKAYMVSLAQVQAAQSALDLETERYNLGVSNFIDYLTANRTLVQALTDKAQAEFRLLFQKIQLDYTLGTLRIEDL